MDALGVAVRMIMDRRPVHRIDPSRLATKQHPLGNGRMIESVIRFFYKLGCEPCSIGRSSKATVQIPHPSLLPIQAVVFGGQDGTFQIMDGNMGLDESRSCVNGKKLRNSILQDGDVITLGDRDVTITFLRVWRGGANPMIPSRSCDQHRLFFEIHQWTERAHGAVSR